jgi:hypothetical protein
MKRFFNPSVVGSLPTRPTISIVIADDELDAEVFTSVRHLT